METKEAIMERGEERGYASRMQGVAPINPYEFSGWRKTAYATGLAVGHNRAQFAIDRAMQKAGVVVVVREAGADLQFSLVQVLQ